MGKIAETLKGIVRDTFGILQIIVREIASYRDDTAQCKEETVKHDGQTKYYIAVKMQFAGELYTVSGPYDSFEEAEEDFDMQRIAWADGLDEDQYLGIVSHNE